MISIARVIIAMHPKIYQFLRSLLLMQRRVPGAWTSHPNARISKKRNWAELAIIKLAGIIHSSELTKLMNNSIDMMKIITVRALPTKLGHASC